MTALLPFSIFCISFVRKMFVCFLCSLSSRFFIVIFHFQNSGIHIICLQVNNEDLNWKENLVRVQMGLVPSLPAAQEVQEVREVREVLKVQEVREVLAARGVLGVRKVLKVLAAADNLLVRLVRQDLLVLRVLPVLQVHYRLRLHCLLRHHFLLLLLK